MLKNNLIFRSWYYFRSGWSMYFAFILAAINTLTVTYFLAIENYPVLKSIFPSFEQYIVIIISIGIPTLILIGYAHFKRTQAYRAETDVWIESNPYHRRMVVNTELILELNLKLIDKLIKISNNKELTDKENKEIEEIQKEMKEFTETRTFDNKVELDYFKDKIKNRKH
jgi:hypothetical protein